jgi:hypothetical protein
MLKLEAVTVCIGYADFLAQTAKYNVGLFDEWFVITTESDEQTREVCRRHSIKTLLSDDAGPETPAASGDGKTPAASGGVKRLAAGLGPRVFNKGRLIERGLQFTAAQGWRLHLDADIICPPNLHQLLAAADLDERKIYGADRIMIHSSAEFAKLLKTGWLTHTYHVEVRPPSGFQIGTRWAHHEVGYVPIGFFQLWNSTADLWRGTRIKPYPTQHNTACRTDVQHALQWDRSRRELIPELYVVHLESEPAPLGANWSGRTTRPWIPYGV